jgi:glycosyltransferase involved in cell wall biosynthesis
MRSSIHCRVIRLVEDYPVGGNPSYGLQPVFYYLSKEQAKRGHEVNIISRQHGEQPSTEEIDGVRIYRVPKPFNKSAYQLVRKLDAELGNSIIHTHSTSGLFMSALKSTLRSHFVCHVHGASRSVAMPAKIKFSELIQEYSMTKMWYYYFRERLLWSSSHRVLAVSSALKNDLVTYYKIPESRIDVVYNGVDTELFKRRPSFEIPETIKKFEGKKIVLYVGHFGPRKGVNHLIQAMKYVVEQIPQAALVCVGGVPLWLKGSGYWENLYTAIEKASLKDKVLLLDRVPNSELPKYYSAASVFVLASYYEAFAKVVIEAMACGLPVIVTREGGLGEAVEDGKSGKLVDYGSIGQLATAITDLLQDDKLSRAMGAEARLRIERDFTWRAVADRIDNAYYKVLSGDVSTV